MSETEYGFDPVKFRAARGAAGASVAQISRAAGVTGRTVNLYLAGSRVPRPEVLVQVAAAVGVAPADLCTVEHEVLAHLRAFADRSRAATAQALGMAEETYPQLETTGQRGRLSSSRYDHAQDRWITWQEWAPPLFGVTAERLPAAGQHTQEHYNTKGRNAGGSYASRTPTASP
ncbi:helix-turn-helix domain-containing protein [Streptomyces sp. NPDC004232]|uniref:helix-turn-helix domain-containing protein n=1 Tax=Streptomyces sp. NPDC004232 TaxID=3154454 RepID=UPI001D56D60A|nr:helix-turn-helix domain-containing protein [Streptomyces sp. tea 10]